MANVQPNIFQNSKFPNTIKCTDKKDLKKDYTEQKELVAWYKG